jgi:MscS family membrane protein
MKIEFRAVFKGLIAVLVTILFWSLWAGAAQTTVTNTPPAEAASAAAPTNAAGDLLARYIPEESNVTPDWVEALAKSFPFLKWQLLGNAAWKYLASLVYIFLAFYVSKLLDYLTRVWLKRWTDSKTNRFDSLVLDLLNGPIRVVAFVIFLHIGLNIFQWPGKVQIFLSKGFTVIVAATLTYMVLKLVDLLLGYWRQRSVAETDRAFNDQLFPIVRKSLKAFIIVVAVLVTAQNLDINVTAAITSLSIGSLAVGLAAQDTLANFFGAIAVFIDKPFRIGDTIRLDSVEGTVESIGMRSTRVRNGNGFLVTIPNKTVGNATITNITRRPTIRSEMNLALAYETPFEKLQHALAILDELHRAQSMISDLSITLDKFAEKGVNVQITYAWGSLDQTAYMKVVQELNLAIKQRFDQEGIRLAFPCRTIYLRQDSEWRMLMSDKSKMEGSEVSVRPTGQPTRDNE